MNLKISERIEYYKIVKPILKNEEFQKRKTYLHHGNISVYQHSLKVSKLSYYVAKKLKCDYKSAAIGGLLHDFYPNPWQENQIKKTFFKKHGFVHAHEAKINSKKYFPDLMNKTIENIIERHMFPLNKIPPKYKEAWIVSMIDKYVSLEVFLQPKQMVRLIGIRLKTKEV